MQICTKGLKVILPLQGIRKPPGLIIEGFDVQFYPGIIGYFGGAVLPPPYRISNALLGLEGLPLVVCPRPSACSSPSYYHIMPYYPGFV
jgi:hypothetical protein